MKKFKIVLYILILILPGINLFSQSNDLIDRILEMNYIDFQDGVYLILAAGEKISDDTTPAMAVEELKRLDWHIKIKDNNENLTFGEVSLLIMNSLELKGGIMYSILHNRRYSYKEMVFKNLIPGTRDINSQISGMELINILGKSLELKEGADDA